MCMDGKAALLVMNLGVQREENEQCVYSACKLGEERASSRNPATAPRGYVQGDRRQCGVELHGIKVSCKRDSSGNE